MDINYVKKVMKVNGITQKDLSQMANIPLQTIRKIFAGYTSHPRIDTVEAIEKALGINYSQEQEYLDLFNKLLNYEKKFILEIMQFLINKKGGCYGY